MIPRESVVVERRPFGTSSFSLCRAEVAIDGTLTVEVVETGAVMATFPPGKWVSARGVGASGLTLYERKPSDALRLAGA